MLRFWHILLDHPKLLYGTFENIILQVLFEIHFAYRACPDPNRAIMKTIISFKVKRLAAKQSVFELSNLVHAFLVCDYCVAPYFARDITPQLVRELGGETKNA